MSEHHEYSPHEPQRSFISLLLEKLSRVRDVGETTGKDVGAAEREVLRQIRQASGNPITGNGVTKSGEED